MQENIFVKKQVDFSAQKLTGKGGNFTHDPV